MLLLVTQAAVQGRGGPTMCSWEQRGFGFVTFTDPAHAQAFLEVSCRTQSWARLRIAAPHGEPIPVLD